MTVRAESTRPSQKRGFFLAGAGLCSLSSVIALEVHSTVHHAPAAPAWGPPCRPRALRPRKPGSNQRRHPSMIYRRDRHGSPRPESEECGRSCLASRRGGERSVVTAECLSLVRVRVSASAVCCWNSGSEVASCLRNARGSNKRRALRSAPIRAGEPRGCCCSDLERGRRVYSGQAAPKRRRERGPAAAPRQRPISGDGDGDVGQARVNSDCRFSLRTARGPSPSARAREASARVKPAAPRDGHLQPLRGRSCTSRSRRGQATG